MAWVAGELGHPAEISGMKATKEESRAGQSPRRDKVLRGQALGGQAGRDSHPIMRRALREGRWVKIFLPQFIKMPLAGTLSLFRCDYQLSQKRVF